MGSYRIVRLIAEGGMGQVYEVRHETLGRRAALKMLKPEAALSEEMDARFLREARAMSVLQHPALIHVYEYGHLDDGAAYIVMEYVEGQTLREFLQECGGQLAPLDAVLLARQIASAMIVAHNKGVVHRDLKPDNIKLVPSEDSSFVNQIKILDFGIAKYTSTHEKNATRPGQVLGTPAYMAPEQAGVHGVVGPHTDVYALGALLFEMLSGQLPFDGEGAFALIGKHLYAAPPRLKDSLPDINLKLDELVNQMLSKSPETRPTMRDVKARLRQIRDTIAQTLRTQTDKTADGPEQQEESDPSQDQTFVLITPRLTPAVHPQKYWRGFKIYKHKSLILGGFIIICGFMAITLWLIVSAKPNRNLPDRNRATEDSELANKKPQVSESQADFQKAPEQHSPPTINHAESNPVPHRKNPRPAPKHATKTIN